MLQRFLGIVYQSSSALSYLAIKATQRTINTNPKKHMIVSSLMGCPPVDVLSKPNGTDMTVVRENIIRCRHDVEV